MTPGNVQSRAQPVTPHQDAFQFGRNWQRYVAQYLDADRVRIAADSLLDLVGDVRGKSFLDIGCGSGVFSLCAYQAGAGQVVSFDVDPESVAATRLMHRRAGSPANWHVLHGSILDPAFLAQLQPADIVYSWGVLHHTGQMYVAIRDAATLVDPGGLFAIAIYNRVSGRFLSSERWRQIKRAYNRMPRLGQRAMQLAYAVYWLLACLRNRQNPIRAGRDYRQSRGMALWTDFVDWLGGYPYEFATAQEIIDFCERFCGLRCEKVRPEIAHRAGNNQFVFLRPSSEPATASERQRYAAYATAGGHGRR